MNDLHELLIETELPFPVIARLTDRSVAYVTGYSDALDQWCAADWELHPMRNTVESAEYAAGRRDGRESLAACVGAAW